MSEAHSDVNVSYWVDSTSPPEFPPLSGEDEVDVAIVGAGIVGLTAARVLKESGRTVALVEMDRIVRGVTGYTTAKITGATASSISSSRTSMARARLVPTRGRTRTHSSRSLAGSRTRGSIAISGD
jgi:glycine/D-amino acid oxidase-like deaminating enzyme